VDHHVSSGIDIPDPSSTSLFQTTWYPSLQRTKRNRSRYATKPTRMLRLSVLEVLVHRLPPTPPQAPPGYLPNSWRNSIPIHPGRYQRPPPPPRRWASLQLRLPPRLRRQSQPLPLPLPRLPTPLSQRRRPHQQNRLSACSSRPFRHSKETKLARQSSPRIPLVTISLPPITPTNCLRRPQRLLASHLRQHLLPRSTV
jgi:hypothetical protein